MTEQQEQLLRVPPEGRRTASGLVSGAVVPAGFLLGVQKEIKHIDIKLKTNLKQIIKKYEAGEKCGSCSWSLATVL